MKSNESGKYAGTLTYLTKRFPRLSETFILEEIIGLEKAGLPLRLVSLADPGESIRQSRIDEVNSDVTYVHRPGGIWQRAGSWASMFWALAEIVLRHPGGFLRGLEILRGRESAKTAARHFLEAAFLARVAERQGSRHIHAAFAHTPAAVAQIASTFIDVPYSFAAHAKDLYLSNPRHLARRLEGASFVLVCSASAREALLSLAKTQLGHRRGSACAERILLQYHGVDIERFKPSVRPATTLGPVILAVGRLVPKKGYPVLIDALGLLRSRGSRFRCRIVGGGALREELQARAAAMGLGGSIEFLGALNQDEVRAEYLGADIFVQASVVVPDGDRDGVPNSVLEAMASGVPVVGTDVAGIPEVLSDGETGLVVPQGDAERLAWALKLLIDEPEARSRIGQAGRELMERGLSREACNAAVAERFRTMAMKASPLVGSSPTIVAPTLEAR